MANQQKNGELYFIKSLKWTDLPKSGVNPNGKDIYFGDNFNGYVDDTQMAGIYTKEELVAHGYTEVNDGETEIIPFSAEIWEDTRIETWKSNIEEEEDIIRVHSRQIKEYEDFLRILKAKVKQAEENKKALERDLEIQSLLRKNKDLSEGE